MLNSNHKGCSASRHGNCKISVFVWYSKYFVLNFVRFLDAENVSAFFLRYLHEIGCSEFGMLQVHLHAMLMDLCFMFPCVAHCVEFAIRRHFNSLCFTYCFLIKFGD